MTTRLRQLVDYLAGRSVEGGDRLREDLADPGSEASQRLAAARELTRASLSDTTLACFDLAPRVPVPVAVAAPPPAKAALAWRPTRRLVAAAALVLVVFGPWWLAERARRRQLEDQFARRDAALVAQLRRLEDAVRGPEGAARGANPPALERIERMEEEVAAIARRLEARKPQDPAPGATLLNEMRLALARNGTALAQLQTRLEEMPPGVAGDDEVAAGRAAERHQAVLTRLRDLSERMIRLERLLAEGVMGPQPAPGGAPGAFRRPRHQAAEQLSELMTTAGNQALNPLERGAALQELAGLASQSPDIRSWLQDLANDPTNGAGVLEAARHALGHPHPSTLPDGTLNPAASHPAGNHPAAHHPKHAHPGH